MQTSLRDRNHQPAPGGCMFDLHGRAVPGAPPAQGGGIDGGMPAVGDENGRVPVRGSRRSTGEDGC